MRYLVLCVLSAALATLAGCRASSPDSGHQERVPTPGTSGTTSAAESESAVLVVHGMGCPQCANNVDTQLLKVPGVRSVSIDMGTGRVLARLSPSDRPTRDQLAKAIENTGFTLVNIEMPK